MLPETLFERGCQVPGVPVLTLYMSSFSMGQRSCWWLGWAVLPSLVRAVQMFLPSLLPCKRGSKKIAIRGLAASI